MDLVVDKAGGETLCLKKKRQEAIKEETESSTKIISQKLMISECKHTHIKFSNQISMSSFDTKLFGHI
jgi:hypothetical protein